MTSSAKPLVFTVVVGLGAGPFVVEDGVDVLLGDGVSS